MKPARYLSIIIHLNVLILSLMLGQVASVQAQSRPATDTSALTESVTVPGIRGHLQSLQNIAADHSGHRAAGSTGYDESVNYVVSTLINAGYQVEKQSFTITTYAELSPSRLEMEAPVPRIYAPDVDFALMTYSSGGDLTAGVEPVDVIIPAPANSNTSTSGCETGDFVNFTPGRIALIQRGTCTFEQKAVMAQMAGAAGVIIFNEGQSGRTDVVLGRLELPSQATIPVFATSYTVGKEIVDYIRAGQPVSIRMFADTRIEDKETFNVLAETPAGDPNNVVMVGAHLDSVSAGPGINDNGSGSAAILEIAVQMAGLGITPRNKVRFAWWGAEEAGLIGSRNYVADLLENNQIELARIALYLNFDMIGSPNYFRGIYSASSGSPVSRTIQTTFTDYFRGRGLYSELVSLGSGSDHYPFFEAGIPVGGLFTGASGTMTSRQARNYPHAQSGVAYDPCYHRACDNLDGINNAALDDMGDAAAHVVLTFAQDETLTKLAVPRGGMKTGLELAGEPGLDQQAAVRLCEGPAAY